MSDDLRDDDDDEKAAAAAAAAAARTSERASTSSSARVWCGALLMRRRRSRAKRATATDDDDDDDDDESSSRTTKTKKKTTTPPSPDSVLRDAFDLRADLGDATPPSTSSSSSGGVEKGEVLKERRSPRERGRMGTSVLLSPPTPLVTPPGLFSASLEEEIFRLQKRAAGLEAIAMNPLSPFTPAPAPRGAADADADADAEEDAPPTPPPSPPPAESCGSRGGAMACVASRSGGVGRGVASPAPASTAASAASRASARAIYADSSSSDEEDEMLDETEEDARSWRRASETATPPIAADGGMTLANSIKPTLDLTKVTPSDVDLTGFTTYDGLPATPKSARRAAIYARWNAPATAERRLTKCSYEEEGGDDESESESDDDDEPPPPPPPLDDSDDDDSDDEASSPPPPPPPEPEPPNAAPPRTAVKASLRALKSRARPAKRFAAAAPNSKPPSEPADLPDKENSSPLHGRRANAPAKASSSSSTTTRDSFASFASFADARTPLGEKKFVLHSRDVARRYLDTVDSRGGRSGGGGGGGKVLKERRSQRERDRMGTSVENGGASAGRSERDDRRTPRTPRRVASSGDGDRDDEMRTFATIERLVSAGRRGSSSSSSVVWDASPSSSSSSGRCTAGSGYFRRPPRRFESSVRNVGDERARLLDDGRARETAKAFDPALARATLSARRQI